MIGAIQRVIAEEKVFVGIVLIASVLSVAAHAFDEVWLSLVPLATIGLIYLLSGSLNTIYLMTALLIPFSTELDIAGGIGLVFPGELMFLLSLIHI